MITNFLSLLLTAITVVQTATTIDWQYGRRLTWNDFKSAPDPKSSNAALTSTSINAEFGFDNKGLKYTITCRFDKSRSWVRVKNDLVLAHEQGHFDIAEIYARKLNKALKEYRFKEKTVGDDVNKIYNDMMTAYHEAQSIYDEETDYSRNKTKQAEWIARIDEDLESLKAFADYRK